MDACPDKWKSAKSDHFLIEVGIASTVTLISKMQIFKDSDYLLDFDFSHCFQSTDVGFIWSELKHILYPKVKLHPVK